MLSTKIAVCCLLQMLYIIMRVDSDIKKCTIPACLLKLLYLVTRKEGNVLFNDTLNTFYLRLYGVGIFSHKGGQLYAG